VTVNGCSFAVQVQVLACSHEYARIMAVTVEPVAPASYRGSAYTCMRVCLARTFDILLNLCPC